MLGVPVALSTRSDLEAALADWINRRDLGPRIPDFIRLTEAKIDRVLRRATVRGTMTIDAEVNALPADCAELRSIRLSSSMPHRDFPITIGTVDMLGETRARWNGAAGRPERAAIVGNELIVAPAPDAAYTAEITYFEKLVPLSDATSTNAVLVDAPDVYLYGALAETELYLKHDERFPLWKQNAEKAMLELELVRQRQEHGASLRPARLPRVF
jgi:hypothetical protein